MINQAQLANELKDIAAEVAHFSYIDRDPVTLDPVPSDLDSLLTPESLLLCKKLLDRADSIANDSRGIEELSLPVNQLKKNLLEFYGWSAALVLANLQVEARHLDYDTIEGLPPENGFKRDHDAVALALNACQTIANRDPESKGLTHAKRGLIEFFTRNNNVGNDGYLPENLDIWLHIAASEILRPKSKADEVDRQLATLIRKCAARLPDLREKTVYPYLFHPDRNMKGMTNVTRDKPAPKVWTALLDKGYVTEPQLLFIKAKTLLGTHIPKAIGNGFRHISNLSFFKYQS